MRIAFGTDEQTAVTDGIKALLASGGHEVVDVGEGIPWPDVGRRAAEAVVRGPAAGDGAERIYVVEPTGPVMDDPNLTDKKFPGNPTLSYRSRDPLRVIGEVTKWQGHSAERLQQMRDGLARLKAEASGEIID